MKTRRSRDSLGQVEIPADKLWGAVTQRSMENFRIGNHPMPVEIIDALAGIKREAAVINHKYGLISAHAKDAITEVCDEIRNRQHDSEFPLSIWQTGSGTHTNMNINEVIANRAEQIKTGGISGQYTIIHPNDDVNKSQSSNDVIPSAIHIALHGLIYGKVLPSLQKLSEHLNARAGEFKNLYKTGRTHMMDAVPMTMGQEFSAFARQVESGTEHLESSSGYLLELAIGGTAIGTGLNAPEGFSESMCERLQQSTGHDFHPAKNHFEALSSRSAIVKAQHAMSVLAGELFKIASDIRMMASGPRTGLHEIELPAMEPGSSIMPGKVNPTQVEALQMACTRIISHDTGSSIANMNGHFQLNVFMPLLAANSIESAHLLGDISSSFANSYIEKLRPCEDQLRQNKEQSLMLATALSPVIGYEKAAETAHYAHKHKISLREANLILNHLDSETFDKLINPENMV
ncbi:MAG: class II fumarate hydratase [Bacteroidota bacterium]